MSDQDISLIAHLMRRAGFGAPLEELQARAAKGYDATVEELLDPESQPPMERDLMMRYKTEWLSQAGLEGQQEEWTFRMINTKRPLEEKMALFWHQLFATSNAKVDNPPELTRQIAMFREHGLGSYRDLLVELAKSPAMIFWLDNHGNHDGAINENWGRELLELFSMGVGNYSEDDIKNAARAFTGWSIAPKIPRNPLGRFFWKFEYKPEDHDNEEKTFLGQTGNFNGEDIMGIIVDQPASPRFLARHLYRFFVADEPQVSAWNTTPPNDPEAIEILVEAYKESKGDIRSILRVLFNSEFFKKSRLARVKSPAELIVGTVRMAGNYDGFKPGFNNLALECGWQGQELLNPPFKAWVSNSRRVSSLTSSGPMASRQAATKPCAEVLPCSLTRPMIARTPGNEMSPKTPAAKFTRRINAPASIHAEPVCQPSTLGGFSNSCPCHPHSNARLLNPGLKPS